VRRFVFWASVPFLSDFHEAGFPTMALFTAVGLFCGAVYLGLTRGEGDAKGSASVLGPLFLSLCVADFVIGIFFLFGPGGVLGARVNTLGLHLIVIAALGIYVGYTNQRTHAKILAALVAVTIFALCGCFPLLNHGEPIWSLSSVRYDDSHCAQTMLCVFTRRAKHVLILACSS
jgi:hypothetical protein